MPARGAGGLAHPLCTGKSGGTYQLGLDRHEDMGADSGFWLDSRRHYFTKIMGISMPLPPRSPMLQAGCSGARLLVQRKDRGDPPHFLRDLIVHYLGRAGQGRPGSLGQVKVRPGRIGALRAGKECKMNPFSCPHRQ